jgi:hypothetical protein
MSRSLTGRLSSRARITTNLQMWPSALEDGPLCPSNVGRQPTPISPAHSPTTGARWTPGSDRRMGRLGGAATHVALVCPQSSTYHAAPATERTYIWPEHGTSRPIVRPPWLLLHGTCQGSRTALSRIPCHPSSTGTHLPHPQ